MAKPMTVSRDVMVKLLDSKKPLTARELGASAVICSVLHKRGFLVKRGEVRIANRRGRPAFRYALASDTRKAMRRDLRKSAKATA